ncbi:SnoaL-like domain-containing protein [Mucisphaera sp.]|uniref:SnoaL-like domain-containing protein n=1 Tax=Mucisphaera sp. TaxID=2913024 RepID=UPI003D11B64D
MDSEAKTIGQQLVSLCQQGKYAEALDKLYADDAISIEAMCMQEGQDRTTTGLDNIKKAGEWWEANHEVHGGEVIGPFPHDDRFAVLMKIDVTPKVGPMANQRMMMEEICLYTVKDGKIVKSEFFYSE